MIRLISFGKFTKAAAVAEASEEFLMSYLVVVAAVVMAVRALERIFSMT